MKIAIIGSGYVGLVTGTCFAEMGVEVACVDNDIAKIENLKKGIMPIYEPGLEEMLVRNKQNGLLSFTTEIDIALHGADIMFIAVGTPQGQDGSADLQYVLAVAREAAEYMNKYLLVVTKSTVPVGTSTKVRKAIFEVLMKRGEKIHFDVASNPEFLKEGAAIDDFMKPDRIVVGVDSDQAEELMTKLYKPFTLNGNPIIFMDILSAEMTKYAANAMLATKISFMNDISNLCEIVGANVNNVRRGIGSDSRIGNKFIYPGIGYGGSCFPKDVKALIKTGSQNGYEMRVIKAVEEVNEDQKLVLYNKLVNYFQGATLFGKTIAIWGLSFKPNTDDMREAPSVVIIKNLLKAGAKVKVFDPIAMNEARECFGDDVEYCAHQYDAIIDANALLIVTEWAQFRSPDFRTMKNLMNWNLIFDGRNMYDAEEVMRNGFEYYCMGIKTSNQ